MDASTISKIESLALDASNANRLNTHVPAIIISNEIRTVEHLNAGRSRFRGKFSTTALTEFAGYVKGSPGGAGFIDAKACTARVFLNLGTADDPGHGDWTASLALDPTAAYAAIKAVDGLRLSQKDLVAWIEDWSSFLSAKFGECSEPSSINTALASIRQLTISAKSDVTHTDKDFGASRSALEEIEAKAAGGIPTHLIFACVPYAGFDRREFALRLSVITGEKPALVLRVVSKEAIEEDIAREFKSRLLEEIGDAATMTIGSFTP